MKTIGEMLAEMEPTGDQYTDSLRILFALGGSILYMSARDVRRRQLLELLEARRQALAAESA